jgi:hypothetical protein
MEVFKRIDSVIITESNKEYLQLYKFIKFYLKACFYWLCYRTGSILVILFCLRINQDAAFQRIKEAINPVTSFIDSIFIFTLLLILMALFYTFVINAIVKPKKR